MQTAHNPIVPMGTKIIMNGVEYTVEDTGNFARYGVAFDVYYDSHSAASNHGHQTWEAFIADDMDYVRFHQSDNCIHHSPDGLIPCC